MYLTKQQAEVLRKAVAAKDGRGLLVVSYELRAARNLQKLGLIKFATDAEKGWHVCFPTEKGTALIEGEDGKISGDVLVEQGPSAKTRKVNGKLWSMGFAKAQAFRGAERPRCALCDKRLVTGERCFRPAMSKADNKPAICFGCAKVKPKITLQPWEGEESGYDVYRSKAYMGYTCNKGYRKWYAYRDETMEDTVKPTRLEAVDWICLKGKTPPTP
jgi:hypothetical protein